MDNPLEKLLQAMHKAEKAIEELAVQHAVAAVTLDPLSPPYRQSYDVVFNRIRSTIVDTKDADLLALLYELLLQHNEADHASHVAYARHLIARGDRAHGERILEAVALLAPNYAPALELLGRPCAAPAPNSPPATA